MLDDVLRQIILLVALLGCRSSIYLVRRSNSATVYRVGQEHVARQAPENAISGANVKRAANDNCAWPIN